MKFLCNKGLNQRMIVPRITFLVRFRDFDAMLVVNGCHLGRWKTFKLHQYLKRGGKKVEIVGLNFKETLVSSTITESKTYPFLKNCHPPPASGTQQVPGALSAAFLHCKQQQRLSIA